jgi:glutathione S-transferase
LSRPRLFVADHSVCVRIARLAIEEKRVDYERDPADVFDPAGPPD